MDAGSKLNRVLFVATGFVFILVIVLEILVLFQPGPYSNNDMGFMIMLHWTEYSVNNLLFLFLISTGLFSSILGMVTAVRIGFDLRDRLQHKVWGMIVPFVIGFSVVFYSFIILLEIPLELVPLFNGSAPPEIRVLVPERADSVVYNSILFFEIGLVLALSISTGMLYFYLRENASKISSGLLIISLCFSIFAIAPIIFAVTMASGLDIPYYLGIGAFSTFVTLTLFSLWLIIQGAKISKKNESKPVIQ